jgi:hypothetical protein
MSYPRLATVGLVAALALLAFGGRWSAEAADTLPDGRGWEMVSPVDKNGGQIDAPGALAGGGVLQAAANGNSVTYGSAASFGEGAAGAPPASQYVSRRSGEGWSTQNITTPSFSGSYGVQPEGVPYQLFSADLARGLLLNGRRCRGAAGECAVANPPLAGTAAPAGYQDYYLRENVSGTFTALLTGSDVAELALDPAHFELSFAGASPDLRHVVLSTCAALTPDATEVPQGAGCDPASPNLYEWSGAGLGLVNLRPGQAQGTPRAVLAAQSGTISADGSRIYWSDPATGDLYLRESGHTELVGEGSFQAASSDGSVAFYTSAAHLYRYDTATSLSIDLTPAGGVQGVLGTSADGSYVYYLSADGLFLRHGATPTKIAAGADSSDYPPTTGTARVSADGTHLAFVATQPLPDYDNTEANAVACGNPATGGDRCSEVYLYGAAANALACASCKAKGRLPLGPSTIPGAVANGSVPGVTDSYKPRVLSDDGRRLFFDSRDALVASDTNGDWDVYEWEVRGNGSCTASAGCVALISSGRAAGGASFVDASSDGSDAFFLTDGSLVGSDPGSVDLYDARVGGGFPEPTEPIACNGDACQSLPSAPVDPTLTTLLPGLGNPRVRYSGGAAKSRRCRHGQVRRRGRCVKRKAHRHRNAHRAGGGRRHGGRR